MTKHQWVKHGPGDCDPDRHCFICDGGLAECSICGLAEGTLTTDCPGVDAKERSDQVYAGELDYREGQGWVNDFSLHSPKGTAWQFAAARANR